MATEEDVVEENIDNEPDNKGKKSAKHDSGATDLEKITDHVEEVEINNRDISDAMKVVSHKQNKEASAKQQKEKELSKVKINKEDVDLIMNELETSRTVAERKLREHKGDVVEALTELIR